MAPLHDALDAFRKLVSFLYREVGAMRLQNHPPLYSASKLPSSDFSKERKLRARELYCASRTETDPERILAPYRAETGLSLEQVHEAFRDGDWLLIGSYFSFGGPKWASIAALTLSLRDAILSVDEAKAKAALEQLPQLRHNHGLIVEKLEELRCT